MSLVLTLVRSPHPQPVREMRLDEGELVIGRAREADWRIDDPDMFVSRAHCTVSSHGGRYTVTDTSSGGLFLDETGRPLGPGNSAPLRHGMRLRLGDYVVSVELGGEPARAPAEPSRREEPAFDADAFFATPVDAPPKPPRPKDLPDPFERPPPSARLVETPERQAPPGFDDPFTLDPPSSRERNAPASGGFDWGAPEPAPGPPRESPPSGGFDWDAPEPAPQSPHESPPAGGFDWGPRVEPAPPPAPEPRREERAAPAAPARAAGPADAEALAAFLRGLGLDPADVSAGDPAQRLEAFGREYRLMVEGLMELLRKRAEEKSGARIARTVIGSAEVNPLKFMPTVDDALAVMAAGRGRGFSDAETAILGAARDLAQHHVSAWRGIQAALRRMVDRFDPAALEREVEELGLLETLLAGGRRAKLWELYEKRYREIAASAETRFLGEVGEHFREAYETGEK